MMDYKIPHEIVYNFYVQLTDDELQYSVYAVTKLPGVFCHFLPAVMDFTAKWHQKW